MPEAHGLAVLLTPGLGQQVSIETEGPAELNRWGEENPDRWGWVDTGKGLRSNK